MRQLSPAHCPGLLPGPGGDPDLLTLSVSARRGYTLMSLDGEGDVTVRGWLHAALTAEVTAGTPHLVVNLSRLNFIDASCLQVLWRVSRMAEGAGGSLVLVAPQPMVARVMELYGAGQVIDGWPAAERLHETEDDDCPVPAPSDRSDRAGYCRRGR